MASRWVVTAALAGVSVITAVSFGLPEAELPPPVAAADTRQISDEKSSSIARDVRPVASMARSHAEVLPSKFDLDIPEHTIEFGLAELDALAATGTATVQIPGHADIELTLTRHETRHGMALFSASHAGLISTFTRRGPRFFGTLATPHESYRLESSGQGSRIIAHRLLAARTIRHEKDFRHAH